MYTYCNENRFEHPITYMYPPFKGMAFLAAYFTCRKAAITSLREMGLKKLDSAKVQPDCRTHLELIEVQHRLGRVGHENVIAALETYIRRFEVAKRLRNSYPFEDSSDLAPLETHVLFYDILINAYQHHQDIRYVNVMLKVGDTLISILETIDAAENSEKLALLIENEVKIVELLMDKLKVPK
ncbi:hypothetical protein OBB02_00700 [Candidatus Puniceispirillum sp.]|nr:hypothetical protein [Candidatus Puniceispirillum sp.]